MDNQIIFDGVASKIKDHVEKLISYRKHDKVIDESLDNKEVEEITDLMPGLLMHVVDNIKWLENNTKSAKEENYKEEKWSDVLIALSPCEAAGHLNDAKYAIYDFLSLYNKFDFILHQLALKQWALLGNLDNAVDYVSKNEMGTHEFWHISINFDSINRSLKLSEVDAKIIDKFSKSIDKIINLFQQVLTQMAIMHASNLTDDDFIRWIRRTVNILLRTLIEMYEFEPVWYAVWLTIVP